MSVSEGSSLAGEYLPLRQRGGASFPVSLAIDEVALKIEVVVNVGVDLEAVMNLRRWQWPASS